MSATLRNLREDPDRLITEIELCEITGLSRAWAQRARWARTGPPFLKINGGRSVRYVARDVLNWLEESRVQTKGAA